MTSTLNDDPSLDAEGWEIANGHQPSPPPSSTDEDKESIDPVSISSPRTDEKFINQRSKIEPKSEINSTSELSKCQFCLKNYKFLKNLGCRCDACMTCSERMLSQWQDENVTNRLCPICDQEHALPSLVHKMLKPVFPDKALKCMMCQMDKDTQDAWWCQDCSLILCSKCAHKKHRDHSTVEFDQDYDAVRFCLSMLQLEEQDMATKFKTLTWAKFEQIFKLIESAIDEELEHQDKIRRIRLTDIFGSRSVNAQNGENGYGIHRRIGVVQQKAKQRFPLVLNEILNLSGLGTKENVDLNGEIVAEKIVDLLKFSINQLNLDDFKLTDNSAEPSPIEDKLDAPIMYLGDVPPDMVEATGDKSERHY